MLYWCKPPTGSRVRKLTAWLLAGWALVRLLGFPVAGELRLDLAFALPNWVIPSIQLLLAALLLLTNYRQRLTWYGRAVACLSFAHCLALARASYPIWNGVVPYWILALVMLGEAGSRHES